MTKSEAWTRHEALKNFYYSCPDDKAWRKYKKVYLQAYKEWQMLRVRLTTVYRSIWV